MQIRKAELARAKDRFEGEKRIVLDGKGKFPKEIVIDEDGRFEEYRLVKTRKGGYLFQR